MKKYLLTNLGITNREVFVCSAPMNLKYVYSLPSLLSDEQKAEMTYTPYEPKLTPALNYSRKLFPQIQKKDILLSYPYESMEPFLQLLKESADDPSVVSIKITIYRLASHARLVDYLCRAAENGKEVDVLIELKARFDEQNNIDYSERLEDAGCNVIYGFEKYKVHSKICLITRVEKGKASHVALLSTGNFNENTAKLYTDLSVLTANPKIINDGISFFQNMAIGKLDGEYDTLLVAPVTLKSTILDLIDEEIKKGEEGCIFAKVNSVTDEEIIVKLKEASCAGVKITLFVRGICCLVPGVAGKTENIEVRQIVGRYLEHSRIYVFGKGEEEKMYIASADFMTRNTERRVEIACPVLDKAVAERIHRIIDIYMADNTKVRVLFPTGRYHKIADVEEPVSAQQLMMDLTAGSEQSIPKPAVVTRPAATVFDTDYKPKKKKKKK
jgi:polyphosphate kinase